MENIEAEGKKKIEDYLHLYIGSKLWVTKNIQGKDVILILDAKTYLDTIEVPLQKEKLLLRPLSSMTEEEQHELSKMVDFVDADGGENYWWGTQVAAYRTKWLLSKSFDLFGLIESGLALQSPQTTLPK